MPHLSSIFLSPHLIPRPNPARLGPQPVCYGFCGRYTPQPLHPLRPLRPLASSQLGRQPVPLEGGRGAAQQPQMTRRIHVQGHCNQEYVHAFLPLVEFCQITDRVKPPIKQSPLLPLIRAVVALTHISANCCHAVLDCEPQILSPKWPGPTLSLTIHTTYSLIFDPFPPIQPPALGLSGGHAPAAAL